VPNVKQRLRLGTPLGDASAVEILGLLNGGTATELDDGGQLTTTWIASDEVVEVIHNGVPANRAELEGCGWSEEILSYKRRSFVVRADAADNPVADQNQSRRHYGLEHAKRSGLCQRTAFQSTIRIGSDNVGNRIQRR